MILIAGKGGRRTRQGAARPAFRVSDDRGWARCCEDRGAYAPALCLRCPGVRRVLALRPGSHGRSTAGRPRLPLAGRVATAMCQSPGRPFMRAKGAIVHYRSLALWAG